MFPANSVFKGVIEVRGTWNCYTDVGDIVVLATSDNFRMLVT